MATVGGWDFAALTGNGRRTAPIARIHDLNVTIEPSKPLGSQCYPGPSRARRETALQQTLETNTPYDLKLQFIAPLSA